MESNCQFMLIRKNHSASKYSSILQESAGANFSPPMNTPFPLLSLKLHKTLYYFKLIQLGNGKIQNLDKSRKYFLDYISRLYMFPNSLKRDLKKENSENPFNDRILSILQEKHCL